MIDDNAELAEIAGAEFTVNYAMLYQISSAVSIGRR